MIDARQMDIMEVEAETMVMEMWVKFEIEFLGNRYVTRNATNNELSQTEQPQPETVGEIVPR